MYVITDKEEENAYGEFMTRVSVTAMRAAKGNIFEFLNNDSNIDSECAEAIGLASGQVVLDRVIELTKDMPKEFMVKMLAELAFSCSIDTMNKNPQFRQMVFIASQFME